MEKQAVKVIQSITELPSGLLAWYEGSIENAVVNFQQTYRRKPEAVFQFQNYLYFPVTNQEAIQKLAR